MTAECAHLRVFAVQIVDTGIQSTLHILHLFARQKSTTNFSDSFYVQRPKIEARSHNSWSFNVATRTSVPDTAPHWALLRWNSDIVTEQHLSIAFQKQLGVDLNQQQQKTDLFFSYFLSPFNMS